jgi:hypothetical protein
MDSRTNRWTLWWSLFARREVKHVNICAPLSLGTFSNTSRWDWLSWHLPFPIRCTWRKMIKRFRLIIWSQLRISTDGKLTAIKECPWTYGDNVGDIVLYKTITGEMPEICRDTNAVNHLSQGEAMWWYKLIQNSRALSWTKWWRLIREWCKGCKVETIFSTSLGRHRINKLSKIYQALSLPDL